MMKLLLPKLKYLISYHNNSSYKFVLILSLLYCFDGRQKYSFDELFRFVVPFYFNMAVRHKITERASGKVPKVLQSIIDYSHIYRLSYLSESDYTILAYQNMQNFFANPLTHFGTNKKISSLESENVFFKYSLRYKYIELSTKFYELLLDNNLLTIVKDVVYVELIKFLEKYNSVPNLYNKISGEIEQRNLSQYKKIFTNKNLPLYSDYCWICGRKLCNDLSIDHFIPFNYITNNELWNLIPVHKSCNSYKNDRLGAQNVFLNLIERNKKLYQINETNPCYSFLEKELFEKYPTFEMLYQKMIDQYISCKKLGYKEIL